MYGFSWPTQIRSLSGWLLRSGHGMLRSRRCYLGSHTSSYCSCHDCRLQHCFRHLPGCLCGGPFGPDSLEDGYTCFYLWPQLTPHRQTFVSLPTDIREHIQGESCRLRQGDGFLGWRWRRGGVEAAVAGLISAKESRQTSG